MKRALLAITGAFNLGGGIVAVDRLVIKALSQADYALDIFCLCEKIEKIDPRYLGAAPVSYRVFKENKYSFTVAVWSSLLRKQYDLVLSDHVNLAAILAPLAWMHRIRYIVWLHGNEVFDKKPDNEGKLGLTAAWKCLASSEFTRERVLGRFPQKKVVTCDLALDPGLYPDNRLMNTGDDHSPVELTAVDGSQQSLGGRVVLFVGRLDPLGRYKGQDILLNAFPEIYQSFPEAQLILVGDGTDYPYYLELARGLPEPVQVHIFLPGYVEIDLLDALYRSCFLFAMPSHGEGFGLVYLEAMAHAKPCLGCRNDAASCVIQDDVTGILVDDPVNAETLAAHILGLMSKPERAKQMGQAGYRLVNSRFLFSHFQERFWEAVADDWQG